jgi:hypothetical protein
MPWERQQIIALKELKSVQHGLQENLPFIQGQRIRLFQDNTNVVACLTKFSSLSKPFMDELYHLTPLHDRHSAASMACSSIGRHRTSSTSIRPGISSLSQALLKMKASQQKE